MWELFRCGPKVCKLKPGDRVAIEPAVPCGKCRLCLSGRYNICNNVRCCSAPPYDGALRRRYVHPEAFCHKLPESVSLEEGSLVEPLSVGVHACSRGGVTLGSRVLICGAGTIGLVNLLTAKAMGAATVAMTDIDQARLEVRKPRFKS
jgi:L-iditol 2-dehydrogenase